jgi:hypothetical protein
VLHKFNLKPSRIVCLLYEKGQAACWKNKNCSGGNGVGCKNPEQVKANASATELVKE